MVGLGSLFVLLTIGERINSTNWVDGEAKTHIHKCTDTHRHTAPLSSKMPQWQRQHKQALFWFSLCCLSLSPSWQSSSLPFTTSLSFSLKPFWTSADLSPLPSPLPFLSFCFYLSPHSWCLPGNIIPSFSISWINVFVWPGLCAS